MNNVLSNLANRFGGNLRRVALTTLAISLAGGFAYAQVSGNTSDHVVFSCGNFKLATDGHTLSGDCNSWTVSYTDPSDTTTEVRTFVEKKTGVSISLNTQIRVNLGKNSNGDVIAQLDHNTAPNGNCASDCTNEAITVVTSGNEAITLSGTCTATDQLGTQFTNDTSINVDQFISNGNGEIVWTYATSSQ